MLSVAVAYKLVCLLHPTEQATPLVVRLFITEVCAVVSVISGAYENDVIKGGKNFKYLPFPRLQNSETMIENYG